MKKSVFEYLLCVLIVSTSLLGCVSADDGRSFSPADYSDPELQDLFAQSWQGSLDWENGGGLDRYTAEIDFNHDPSVDRVVTEITFTLVETHRLSVQNGLEGETAQWHLVGDLSDRTRELHLKEMYKLDPNDFLGTWVSRAILTFGPGWEEFTGEFTMNDGTPINGEVFTGHVVN